MTAWPINISVAGDPAPKGSMKAFSFRSKDGKMHSRVTHDNKRSLPWQESVRTAIVAAMASTGLEILDEPVRVQALFFLRKPKSVKRSHPSTKPDLDKLQRVIGDALEGTLLTNDSRIVEWECAKVYGANPGVQINVSPVKGEK